MKTVRNGFIACLLVACVPLMAFAQVSPETLREISTPDQVETRLGTLKFFDGLPDKATGWQGEQLDSDRLRQELEHHAASVWAAPAVV